MQTTETVPCSLATTSRSIRNRPSLRGPQPNMKLHYSDNFELVAMRHRDFRRSPNPTPEKLRSFKPVAEKVAQRFLSLNRDLCLLHGYDHGDLMTYALVWTTNFLGLYARDGHSRHSDENAKLLCVHLKQRFAELRTLMFKKGRNCFPDAEQLAINLPSCIAV